MKKNCFLILIVLFLCPLFLCGCGTNTTKVDVDSIEISKKNLYLAEGQTCVISAQVFPFNANNQNYIFESSNEAIVSVDDGFVTAKKAGEATIEVISEEGGYKDSCNVLVTKAKDNLAINNFNNMNMPENKETKFSKLAKQTGAVVKTELENDVESAKKVIECLKNEIKNSINDINSQKQILQQIATQNLENDALGISKTITEIQNSMLDGIKATKENLLSDLENTELNLSTEGYTIEKKDMNGVTYVIISKNDNTNQNG